MNEFLLQESAGLKATGVELPNYTQLPEKIIGIVTSGLKQKSEAELVMASNPVGEVPITGTGGVPTTSVTATSTSDSTTGENLTQSQSTISGTGTLKQNSEAELVMASNAVGGTIQATIAGRTGTSVPSGATLLCVIRGSVAILTVTDGE